MSTVGVVGAGLVGCLAALGLSKKGYKVTILELRDDPRKSQNKNLRSINLAVSNRGINALEYVDPELAEIVLSKVIPMTGRMIHNLEGVQTSQNYGLTGKEAINSIDRSYLNELLLNEVEKAGITLKFNHKLDRIDFNNDNGNPILKFIGNEIEPLEFDFIIGADGSFSKVRQNLQKFIRMDYQQEYIDCGYLELSIPGGGPQQNEFLLDKNHLHIWPRDKFMLIALANLDGSFTSTFFAPWDILEKLSNDDAVLEFFEKYFKDSVELIGKDHLLKCFRDHPRGSLLTLNCKPYHFANKVIVIGDAAHSMVPFYGQGMNCGFEDVYVLLKLLEQEKDVGAAFSKYSETRYKDLASILELAKENYKEMSHKVNSKVFLLKKQIDFILTRILKDKWLPLYTMISFRQDIMYSKAVEVHQRQDKILKIIQNVILGAAVFGASRVYKYLTQK
ncbi:Kynurenine 3-monooxygenase [Wickerhamomyces ciferrii]|uniref:Kynurenine 3-monooxygenase n=1 Tax=Wickerhamomyces ciferrii (strain ATCC 14091 / BCRC 22168 / CBS 111 / JCM 3599 / NBRC 0793 / NRRL Y-1031 F-60-10) TaxID=1206466 RepID=K0KL16_WICCF|nr:Kynurenine 3-monooxygenase [Wickerhamomyces ciferrii]CCH42857.1 Kynurenine 3-monooxygenase [Wickerhamomyces ciferrii]